MKRMLYVTIFIIILLVSFLGITYSYEYNDIESLKFELIGPSTLYIDVNGRYEEYGIKVVKNGVDISSSVNIDSSLLDVFKLGQYKVKYEIEVDNNKEYVYRDVIVIDKLSPVINLKGDEIVYITLNDNYYEEGYDVFDNYDYFLNDNVVVSGEIDTSVVGEYELVYSVEDSSGNKTSVKRLIIVKDPNDT